MKTQKALFVIFMCIFSNVVLGQQNLDAYVINPDSNKFVVVASASTK